MFQAQWAPTQVGQLPGQYVTDGNPFEGKPPVFLADLEYGRALSALVITCVDLVVVDPNGNVLIGRRQQHPWPAWWIIGGRMRAGETFETAAMRTAHRELGITIDPEKLYSVGTYNYIWGRRAQEPVDDGSHTVSVTLAYKATPEEIEAIRFNEEYAEGAWIDPRSYDIKLHPAVVKTLEDFVALNLP